MEPPEVERVGKMRRRGALGATRLFATVLSTEASRTLARLANYDVVFIRHGNTGKAASDLQRALTEKGKKQCAAAADGYMTDLLKTTPLAPFAISSPAGRALETASLVLPSSFDLDEIDQVQCIYDGMIQPGASEAFTRLGYAPLSAYMYDSEEIRFKMLEHGKEVVNALGARVAARAAGAALERSIKISQIEDLNVAELKEACQEKGLDTKGKKADLAARLEEWHNSDAQPPSTRQTLCVFGHAVYLAASALRLADLRGHLTDVKEDIMEYNMDEASGILVGKDDSKVLLNPMRKSVDDRIRDELSAGLAWAARKNAIKDKKLEELRELCTERGLETRGTKDEIIERLVGRLPFDM